MDSTTTNPTLAAKVARALDALVADLYLISESDRPYRPFHAPMPPHRGLTAESFREAANIGQRYRIEMDAVDDWFSYYTDQAEHGSAAESYRLLEQVMRACLADLRIVRVRG